MKALPVETSVCFHAEDRDERMRDLLRLFGLRPCRIAGHIGVPAGVLLLALVSANAGYAQEQRGPDLTQMSVEDLMKVEVDSVYGASKFLQTVTHAPASVTIVSSKEIQKYGYRTLGDVLRRVRGFYVIYDRNYSYVGVRGFSRHGDYNARILFLLDGHRVNDNIFDGAYVGTEFPVDIDLIDHIEIIRGANSSLYGAGAFLAVVNVITKRGRDLNAVEASTEAASWESYKGRVSYGNRFNNGLETLLSGSVYSSRGHRRLFFPEFADPATNNGVADNADGDGSYSLFADVIYRDFNIHAVQVSRTKHIPTASFGTVFNDPRTRTTDARGYVDVQYGHVFGEKWEILGRASYDWYDYSGSYFYDYAGTGVPPFTENKDLARGTWWDFELDASRVFFKRHRVTLGTEYRLDLHRQQANYDVQPFVQYLKDDRGARVAAYYLQDEISLRQNLIFVAGLRSDWYQAFGSTYSPRLSLIYSPTQNDTIKLLYSRAFRAPNAYEGYYVSSVSDSANPSLRPEKIRSFEVDLEHYFSSRHRMSASAFLNHTDGLITQGSDAAGGLYANSDALRSKGMELEFAAQWPGGMESLISYSLQDSRSEQTGLVPASSPKHLGKANLSFPLLRQKLFVGLESQYTSRTRSVSGADLGGFLVTNVTLLSRNLRKGLDLSASVYNVFDKRYADSAGQEHRQISIPQDGRSFRIKLTYRFSLRSGEARRGAK